VLGTDGVFHLAYELLLTNTTPASIKVGTVEVRDARTHQVWLTLTGPTLLASMSPLVAGAASADTVIPSTGVGVVWLDVHVGSRAQVPRVLEHRVVASGGRLSFDAVVALVSTKRRAPDLLGPPVRGGMWLASEGCCSDDTHHRRGLAPVNGDLAVPQRFAIDWFLLDDQHRAWIGDPAVLNSYLSYGQPVIAAAAGRVVDTLDGLPDQHPPEPPPIPPIADTLGNHVTIKVGPGLFLLYGHLQPGSVRVRRGRRVRRGQVLGLIGTSGNSTTPHLHFQVITTPTFFPTDSPPFRFNRFDLVGQVTERIWDDNIGLQPTGLLPFAPARQPGRRRRQMPLDRNVVSFPAPR
jgi:Peptidase family M23